MANNFAEAFEKLLKKKSGEEREREEREGEETLKRTLRAMYEAYRDKKSPKPDYAERYPKAEKPTLDADAYRSGYDLRAEAEAAAREKYAARRDKAEKTNAEIAAAAREKKETAYEDFKDGYRAAGERESALKRRAAETIAANGAENSTVAEAIGRTAKASSETLRSGARDDYRSAVRSVGEKLAAAEETYRSAIRNFEIAEAAETEKTLFKLKKERDAALAASGKAYEKAAGEAETENAAREKRIAADEAARDGAFRQTLFENADRPYGDGEAGEMENRYRIAERYYASLPKKSAAKLFAASEEELKFLLGSYFEKLKESIDRK